MEFPLLSIINRISKTRHHRKITIRKILLYCGYRNKVYIIFIMLSLPLILPIPMPPGIVAAISILLLFTAINSLFSEENIKLPQFIMNSKINIKIIRKINNYFNKHIKFIQSYSRRRCLYLTKNATLNLINKIIIIILTISCIIVPVPFFNIIPAICIVLISMAKITEDGYILISGYIMFAILIALAALILHTTKATLEYHANGGFPAIHKIEKYLYG